MTQGSYGSDFVHCYGRALEALAQGQEALPAALTWFGGLAGFTDVAVARAAARAAEEDYQGRATPKGRATPNKDQEQDHG